MSGPVEMNSRTQRRAVIFAVAVMLLVSGILSFLAALNESPTSDEPLHATAGYMIRWMGDYRVDVEDPALFTLLSTLPQQRTDLHVLSSQPALWGLLVDHRQQWDVVTSVMFRTPRPDMKSIYSGVDYIARARPVFLGIDLALGAMIACWAYRLAGTVGALIAAGLFAFDPNFMAHGPLVKNDVLITLTMVWLMYSLWLLGQRATLARMASVAAACACGLNVKFSGPFLGVLLIAALLIRSIDVKPWPFMKRTLSSRAAQFGAAAALCIGVGVICWASIWTLYGWRFSAAPDPAVQFDRVAFEFGVRFHNVGTNYMDYSTEQIQALPIPLTARVLFWIDDHRLLPDAWVHGFLYTYTTFFRSTFLMGQKSLMGWWYYFPLAMLFKTPLAVLVAIAILVTRFVIHLAKTRRIAPPSWDSICLWIPILLYGAMALCSHLNLGLRHVLPLYPFIYLLIATNLARWTRSIGRRGSWFAAGVVILTAAESLAAWPHQLAFFNVAAGGARGGIRLLSDSNLDWGQDLPLVAEWQQAHPDTRLYLAYFGSTDPHAYGIDYVNVADGYHFSELPVMPMNLPGVFAISATDLQGTYAPAEMEPRLAYLKDRQPLAVLGGSIYLYDWNPADYDAFLARRGKP